MSRTYKVDPVKYAQFALRKTLKRTLLFILISILFLILLVILSGGRTDFVIFQSPWVLIILPVYILIIYFQQNRLARSLVFKLDETKLEKILQRTPSTKNVEARIFLKDIKNLVITKNTLKVKDRQYNMFTRRGLISIPKEVEDYTEIVDFFRKFQGGRTRSL